MGLIGRRDAYPLGLARDPLQVAGAAGAHGPFFLRGRDGLCNLVFAGRLGQRASALRKVLGHGGAHAVDFGARGAARRSLSIVGGAEGALRAFGTLLAGLRELVGTPELVKIAVGVAGLVLVALVFHGDAGVRVLAHGLVLLNVSKQNVLHNRIWLGQSLDRQGGEAGGGFWKSGTYILDEAHFVLRNGPGAGNLNQFVDELLLGDLAL